MICEVPAQISNTYLVAKGTHVQVHFVAEVRDRFSDCLQVVKTALPNMVGVELGYLKLLFAFEVHHKDIERICTGELTVLDLSRDNLD